MYARYHASYTKKAQKELFFVFRKWARGVEWSEITEENYKSEIIKATDIVDLTSAYANIYRKIGLIHGQRVGKQINSSSKNFVLEQFLSLFERNIAQYLLSYGAQRIVTVRNTFFQAIIDIIATRIENGQNIREVAREIQRQVSQPNFYRWQAERIARTESTAASNYAAIQAANVSGFVMVKEWISATDKRVRVHPQDEFDHLEMNGIQIPLAEKFVFNGGDDELSFPGDPQGQAGNVINCRCTIAVVPKRDSNGDLIPIQ